MPRRGWLCLLLLFHVPGLLPVSGLGAVDEEQYRAHCRTYALTPTARSSECRAEHAALQREAVQQILDAIASHQPFLKCLAPAGAAHTVLVYVDALHTAIVRAILANRLEYVRRHGYRLCVAQGALDETRPPSWNKIPAILTVLPHTQWLTLFDADAVITDMSKRLEVLVDTYANASTDLLLSKVMISQAQTSACSHEGRDWVALAAAGHLRRPRTHHYASSPWSGACRRGRKTTTSTLSAA